VEQKKTGPTMRKKKGEKGTERIPPANWAMHWEGVPGTYALGMTLNDRPGKAATNSKKGGGEE